MEALRLNIINFFKHSDDFLLFNSKQTALINLLTKKVFLKVPLLTTLFMLHLIFIEFH